MPIIGAVVKYGFLLLLVAIILFGAAYFIVRALRKAGILKRKTLKLNFRK